MQCPTLIVHRAKDAMCPQFHADYLKVASSPGSSQFFNVTRGEPGNEASLKENIRGSKMVVMEEGKHHLHLKYAQESNLLIEQ